MEIAGKIIAKKERAIQIRDRLTELKALTESDENYELTSEEVTALDEASKVIG